ncbi:MAG: thioredoxin-dependent thiol peroxidase [Bacteroidetes bacterium]|nr:thioredoxin-dependent thiol peroxidase [Bacteroidota bacterium]MCY4234408.1 thioredoxin-dependent thiol peroxidase [Bacteroidota bacterium]
MLEVGDQAPDFEGISTTGDVLRLSDYSGSKVALYFYPKDDTSGCTAEACSIRDHWQEFEKSGIIVIGVSADSAESHQKFTTKYDLPFTLLADTDQEVINAYGVWGEKKMYGKTFYGIKRTTFLIDESGKIVKKFKRPKTKIHGTEILQAFQELS